MKRVGNVLSVLLVCFIFMGSVFATMEVSSPEAFSFSKVEGAEPGADGGVGFSIPIGTVVGRNGMDLPISLGYGAGIKLNQEASWVGLGFNLGIGAVTRSPVGVPDDTDNGFLWGGTSDFKDQDYYSVSFPGGGGKIIFDEDKVPHFATWQNMKIDVEYNNQEIDKWIITTMSGSKYVFEEKAYSRIDVSISDSIFGEETIK